LLRASEASASASAARAWLSSICTSTVPRSTTSPSRKRIAVTVFEAFDVTSTDSLAWVVPTASISMPIGSMRAGFVMTGMSVAAVARASRAAGGADSEHAPSASVRDSMIAANTAGLALSSSESGPLRSLHDIARWFSEGSKRSRFITHAPVRNLYATRGSEISPVDARKLWTKLHLAARGSHNRARCTASGNWGEAGTGFQL
jgi:hypothetical protein